MTVANDTDGMGIVPGPEVSQLGRLARRGVAWTFGQTVLRHVISLGATAVLARILTPQDYGLIGMVATLTAFLQVFSDMGLSWATVQRKDLTQGQMDNLFWANTVFGTALCGLVAVAGPALAWFYGHDELFPVAAITGLTFVFGGIAVQPMALLKRRMRFKPLALTDLASTGVGAAVGLVLAILGFGYWALVWQAVARQAARLVLLFVWSGYRPGKPATGRDTLKLVTLGGYLVIGGLASYLGRNMDAVVLGKAWGPEDLAYYGRAFFLATLPGMLIVGSFGQVLFPALSSVQEDRVRFENAYRKALRVISLLGLPMTVGLCVASKGVVQLVYGPQWVPVGRLLALLCLATLLDPVAASLGALYLSKGRVRHAMLMNAVWAILVSTSAVIAVRWGPTGVAIGRVIVGYAIVLPVFWLAHRTARISMAKVVLDVAGPLCASVAMASIAWLIGTLAWQASNVWCIRLSATVGSGVLTYGILAAVFFRRTLRDMLGGLALGTAIHPPENANSAGD